MCSGGLHSRATPDMTQRWHKLHLTGILRAAEGPEGFSKVPAAVQSRRRRYLEMGTCQIAHTANIIQPIGAVSVLTGIVTSLCRKLLLQARSILYRWDMPPA
jgi:hypothetical protein